MAFLPHDVLCYLSYCFGLIKIIYTQELCAMEDLIADYVELRTEMTGRVITEQTIHSSPGTSFAQAAKLHKLVALACAMTGDPAFARQARKRFL